MAITNFSQLKTAVADWLDRDDLTLKIPDFITIAEARHARELRIRSMITRSTASIGASSRFLALPSDFLEMYRLMLNTTPETILQQVSPVELTRRVESNSGKPRFFTVHEEIEFDRTPDGTYTAELLYWAKFTALSDAATANSLLTNHPDIYLYSTLSASAPFLHDDERLQTWEALYNQSVAALKKSDKFGQYGSTPLFSQPSGSTP